MSESEHRGPRRPTPRASWDGLQGSPDPAERSALAHETAAAVVRLGRDEDDETLTARLVGLADEVGLESLADLWRDSSPDSLPGTLWALYLLRTWVQRSGAEAARVYAAGRGWAEVSDAVAGVAEPPGPQEMARLGDAVLTSVFDGDRLVTVFDLMAIRSHLCQAITESTARYDVNGDGRINVFDMLVARSKLTNTAP